MRLIASFVILAIIVFIIVAPSIPTIQRFIKKKKRDLNRQFDDKHQDEDERL